MFRAMWGMYSVHCIRCIFYVHSFILWYPLHAHSINLYLLHVYSFILISFAHSFFYPYIHCTFILLSWYPLHILYLILWNPLHVHSFILIPFALSFFYPDIHCKFIILSWYTLQVHSFTLISISSSFLYPDIYFKFILLSWYPLHFHSFILISISRSFF